MSGVIRTEEEYNALREQIALDGATLTSYELLWRDRQQFLEEKGYMLRPRLHAE